jgi:fumarate hydratase class II
MNRFRKESDSLGIVEVPEEALWGAQTERSRQNFVIGGEKMPNALIRALALIKKAAAIANNEANVLPKEKCTIICKVVDEILAGSFMDQFPLVIWQTGSGTQTNMNVNEVIANRANELLGAKRGAKSPIHPNDDVNKSQSTNDVFPSAIYIAAVTDITKTLMPALKELERALRKKAKAFHDIIKVGRTHLMDAAPLTLGQEFSGYATQVGMSIEAIESTLSELSDLAVGGTAVGTGLNAPKGFGERVCKILTRLSGIPFTSAENKFASLAAHDAAISTSGALRRTACALFKIASDIRLLASGPRAGFAEIFIPTNEPGSSIMPGKVNPTQCEALMMVAIQVMGLDAAIGFAGSLGNFELNVFKPLIGYDLLRSICLLGDGVRSFTHHCVSGIEPNRARIQEFLENSLMLATALNTTLGYDKATEIVKKAYKENISLSSAAQKLGVLTEEEFKKAVDPKKMVFI